MGNIIEGAKGFLRVAGAWTSKHSPEILLTTAGVGFLATIYFTVKATRENDILDEVHEDYLADVEKNSDASEEEKAEIVKLENRHHIVCKAKATVPAVAAGIVTVVSVGGMYGVLKAQVAQLAAWGTGIATAFKLYRERNIEKYGEEADRYCMYGATTEKITVKNGETGKKETVEQVVITEPAGNWASPTAVMFTKFDYEHRTGSKFYSGDMLYDRDMLNVMERYFIGEYEAGKIVYLKDVYEKLGFDVEDMVENGLRGYPKDAILKMGWWKGHERKGSDGYFSLRVSGGPEMNPFFIEPDAGYGDEEDEFGHIKRQYAWIIDPNVPGIIA